MMKPKTGQVIALIGGKNYQNSQYGFIGGYDDLEIFDYMNQNMKYFILMIILLLTYRKINITKKTS